MKAISLPTHMVVVLILAAVVLTIVIVMFKGVGGSAIDTLKLERERGSLCKQYVRTDPDCDGNPKVDIETKIQKICNRLGGYSKCSSAGKDCTKQCCPILCVTTTSTIA
jgi:hypothetical protein